METQDNENVRVVSRAFSLWKDKEKTEGRKITLDSLVKDTGLAKMTVRRFVAEDGNDVTGSPISSAAAFARYFGVGLEQVVQIVPDPTQQKAAV